MADEQIRISIGAVENASLDRVFGNVRRKATRAAKDVSQAFARGSKEWADSHTRVKSAAAQAATSVAKSARQAAGEETRAAKSASKERESAEKAWSKAFEQESKRRLRFSQMELRQRTRDHKASIRAQLMEERRAQRESARTARQGERDARRHASRLSHRATRFFWPNAPMLDVGRRVAGDIARGVGIDTSLSSQVQNTMDARGTAAYLSNVARRPDGSRRSTDEFMDMGSNLVKNYGVKGGINAALGGAQRFFAQRGDMSGFDALSGDLAKRSVTYNVGFEDLSHTAAKFDSALANVEQFKNDDASRWKAVLGLVNNAIEQGNVGSIEIEDMAKEIPKLSGIAGMVGGDIGTNLKELMAIAQLAERGPAKNAASAGTFTQNFALDLPKRAQAFKDIAGINLFDDQGQLKNLQSVILDTMAATEKGGVVDGAQLNQVEMLNKLLPNKRSFLALQEFVNVFRGAGGGEKGLDAIRGEFQKFSGGKLAESKLDEDFKNAAKAGAPEMEKFNEALREITGAISGDFIKAVVANKDELIGIAETLGSLATWMVENPKVAIGGALVAAIGRSGIETAFRAGIERALLGSSGGIGAGAAAGLKGALGMAAPAIAVAAGAAIAAAFGYGIQQFHTATTGDDRSLFSWENIKKDLSDFNEMATFSAEKKRAQGSDALSKVLGSEVSASGTVRKVGQRGFADDIGSLFGRNPELNQRSLGGDASTGPQLAELKSSIDKMSAKLSGTLNVNVKNPQTPTQVKQ